MAAGDGPPSTRKEYAAVRNMEVPGERAAEHPQGVRRRRKRQSRQRRTRGGGPYGYVYRSISGSEKRSGSIRHRTNPRLHHAAGWRHA